MKQINISVILKLITNTFEIITNSRHLLIIYIYKKNHTYINNMLI